MNLKLLAGLGVLAYGTYTVMGAGTSKSKGKGSTAKGRGMPTNMPKKTPFNIDFRPPDGSSVYNIPPDWQDRPPRTKNITEETSPPQDSKSKKQSKLQSMGIDTKAKSGLKSTSGRELSMGEILGTKTTGEVMLDKFEHKKSQSKSMPTVSGSAQGGKSDKKDKSKSKKDKKLGNISYKSLDYGF